ncbi:MAG: peptidoglycan DD-metalloendopeptidase family protein [Clostridia bacterium]|nr:peptidoglycan DD-metalloendopeptidase family protein [Clostridia bacterium]
MKKSLCFLLILSTMFTTVFASSAQNKLDETNKSIKTQKEQLNQIKSDKKDTLAEIDSLDKQISTTESTISSLELEIEDLEDDISLAESNLEYSQKQYDAKDAIRKKRVAAYYENGTTSYWEMLLTSENMSDYLYRKQILEDVMDFDKNLLDELTIARKQIEEEKKELEENKLLVENKKKEAEEKKLALNQSRTVRTTYLAELNASEKTLSDSIDKLQQQADSLVAQIRAASSSSSSSKYTGGTMAWPLPGFYTITSPFGNRLHPVLKVYKMHTGVDIAGSGCNGKNVVAAADGTVITAGWISGYGNTVIIDHGGGITTLYGHSQKLLVSKGQKVSRGQAIMLVGMTGYATGPHLHFEVRENGKYVNPMDGYLQK